MTTFIAREPVDLLAVVPYAIGFHPEESVVLLTFGSFEDEHSFHARVDLPAGEPDRRRVATMLRELALRRGSRQVGLVLYTEDAAAAAGFAALLVPELVAAGLEVVDVLRVAGDRYFTVGEDSEDGEGRRFDLEAHPLTLARAEEGRVVHPTRAALAASLRGDDEADRAEVHAASDRVADQLLAVGHEQIVDELRAQARWLEWRVRSGLDDPGAISVADAGRILVLVALESLREVVWARMSRPEALAHAAWWAELLRRSPWDLCAGPASLLAFSAWLDGQGALARCALERCFAVDPGDPLGQYVAALLESATPPAVWSPLPETALRVFATAPAPDDQERSA
jgi:hypothetical protein